MKGYFFIAHSIHILYETVCHCLFIMLPVFFLRRASKSSQGSHHRSREASNKIASTWKNSRQICAGCFAAAKAPSSFRRINGIGTTSTTCLFRTTQKIPGRFHYSLAAEKSSKTGNLYCPYRFRHQRVQAGYKRLWCNGTGLLPGQGLRGIGLQAEG